MPYPHAPDSKLGFLRLGVAVPEHRVAECDFNARMISGLLGRAADSGCQLLVLPEMCLTGYTCGDLFYQPQLHQAAEHALDSVREGCRQKRIAAVVGLPVPLSGRIYNVAAFLDAEGRIAGLVPKTFLPNSGEFYEARWFARGDHARETETRLCGANVPFGTDLLFGCDDARIGVEICEDLWAVKPPSLDQALAGANVLLNLSASNELLGKAAYRRDLVRQQSARCLAAYAYASAGPGESSTDLVFSGHSFVAENGAVLCETARFRFDSQLAFADIDLQKIAYDRTRNSSFVLAGGPRAYRTQPVSLPEFANQGSLLRSVDRHPFVPADLEQRAEHCREIFSIQSTGLAKRLRHTGVRTLVLGLSGGLDSTLAAMVASRTFEMLRFELHGVTAVTMPGFGTTDRTRKNAETLAGILGFNLRQISINESMHQHFRDIGHLETQHDTTFENCQARERTQILMDVANQTGGLVLGTGDLSELALGWCTFNGDHMSMYHVNAGVPKTLVRYLVRWCADTHYSGAAASVLHDICETPITPELLPVGEDGTTSQKTEEVVGPYELHDFFLFQFVRCGSSPAKIRRLALHAFGEEYAPATIDQWLEVFIRRFFQQQFKRNAMPDGPKIGSVALSPRGDWRMPSDASSVAWL